MSRPKQDSIKLTPEIKKRLTELRNEKRCNNNCIARALGKRESYVKNIISEHGSTKTLSKDGLAQWSFFFQVSPDYILCKTNDKNTSIKDSPSGKIASPHIYPISFEPKYEVVYAISNYLSKDENIETLNSLYFLFFSSPDSFRNDFIKGLISSINAFKKNTLWQLSEKASHDEKTRLLNLLAFENEDYRKAYTNFLEARKYITERKYKKASILLLKVIHSGINNFAVANNKLSFDAYTELLKITDSSLDYHVELPQEINELLSTFNSDNFNQFEIRKNSSESVDQFFSAIKEYEGHH